MEGGEPHIEGPLRLHGVDLEDTSATLPHAQCPHCYTWPACTCTLAAAISRLKFSPYVSIELSPSQSFNPFAREAVLDCSSAVEHCYSVHDQHFLLSLSPLLRIPPR